MTESNQENSKKYRCYKVVMEMVKDRGYLVSDSDLNMSMEQFIEWHAHNDSGFEIRKTRHGDINDQILVLFTERLGNSTVKNTISQIQYEGVHTVIFVVRKHVTPIALATCSSSVSSVNVHVQVFKETELLFNVTKHKRVPEHQLLTEDDKKTLLQKYTLKESELPRIQLKDPVARYYGLRRGQVVKITRRSETAGKYATYRLVV